VAGNDFCHLSIKTIMVEMCCAGPSTASGFLIVCNYPAIEMHHVILFAASSVSVLKFSFYACWVQAGTHTPGIMFCFL